MAEHRTETLQQVASLQATSDIARRTMGRDKRVQFALVFASFFAFMGVIGKLVFIPGMGNFRGYYLVLPAGLLTLAFLGTRFTWKAILICVPMVVFFIFAGATARQEIISQSYASMAIRWSSGKHSTILSAFLFVTQSLFVIVAASHVKNASSGAKVRLIELFLLGYLVTLFVGYVFLTGRLGGVLSQKFVNTFNPGGLPTDKRFCPGSGANEYGITCSFALMTMLVYRFCGMDQRQPRTWIMLLIGHPLSQIVLSPLTFVAMLFTNTRSALIAIPMNLGWILFREYGPKVRRLKIYGKWVPYLLMALVGVPILIVVLPVAINNNEHLKKLYDKFGDAAEGEGSSESRLIMWNEAVHRFSMYPLLGAGYPVNEYIHNTYLQITCDLGILGVAALIATGALLAGHFQAGAINVTDPVEGKYLTYVKEMGLLHVLWFSATGHNFDHFLPWFLVLLLLSTIPPLRTRTSIPSYYLNPGRIEEVCKQRIIESGC